MHEHDSAVREGALSQARADSLAAVSRHLDSLQAKRSQDSIAWIAKDRALAVQVARGTTMSRQLGDSAARLDSALRAHLAADTLPPDSRDTTLRFALAEISALQTQRDTLLSVVRADSTRIVGLEMRLVQADSTNHDLRAFSQATTNALNLERKRASPNLLQRVGQALPYLAAGILIGKLL